MRSPPKCSRDEVPIKIAVLMRARVLAVMRSIWGGPEGCMISPAPGLHSFGNDVCYHDFVLGIPRGLDLALSCEISQVPQRINIRFAALR